MESLQKAKDGKVTEKFDSSTIGTNSKLKYTANGDAPKQEVTLADGLNFKMVTLQKQL